MTFYRLVAVCLLALWSAGGCVRHKEASVAIDPTVKLEIVQGSDIPRIILTSAAVKRIDIQTSPVVEKQVDEGIRKVVPYSSILYDTQGNTWTYSSLPSLTFVRTPITVDSVSGSDALISSGPPVGSLVVTTGATELYGSESEFKEE